MWKWPFERFFIALIYMSHIGLVKVEIIADESLSNDSITLIYNG